MCWKCDNPDMTHDDYLRLMRGLIDEHGWAVQYVEADRPHSPWAYTAGLTRFGQPELVVTGLPPRQACAYLNAIGSYLTRTATPLPGDSFELVGERVFEVVAVEQPLVHLPITESLVGPDFEAIQMVWRDDRGKLPWDRGFRSGRWSQLVLGARAPSRCTCDHEPHR